MITIDEKIVVLDERDKVRKRINVFHGSNTNHINMIKELIGNSLDIFSKNEKSRIIINIHDENKIEYIDSGRGIPVEGTASDGSPNYVAIFEKTFAGSKYDSSMATVGQNGIFLATLQYSCENIEFYISRPNKNIYYVSYDKGYRSNDLKIIGKSDETYSKIIFELDKEVWVNPVFTFDEICEIAEAQASLGNVEIIVKDIKNTKEKVFYYSNGIYEYFNEKTSHKEFVVEPIKLSQTKNPVVEGINKEDKVDIDMIFSYSNDSDNDIQKEFLNTADLLLHGTIQEGIYTGFKNSINKYLKENKKYDNKEKQITIDDISQGLNYICNVKSLYVEYDNQIKQRTSAKHYRVTLQETIEEFMEIFFIENPNESEKICNQVLINKRVRETSETNRKKIKNELSQQITNATTRPEKFVPCRSKIPSEIELILIEGDSALNSIKLSRDSETMCIYPLKGKPLNTLKKKINQIMDNQEIKDIFKILGCGMEYKGKSIKGVPKFDMEKLQVGKILIATDQDLDGFHIQSLLIGLFYTLAPELIRQGKIFVLYTPLYIIKTKKKEYVAYTEEEKTMIINNLNGERFIEKRFKGLGGLDVNTMADSMDRELRVIKQITMNDILKSKEVIDLFLSEEKSLERKEFIEEHGDKYFDYSLLEG